MKSRLKSIVVILKKLLNSFPNFFGSSAYEMVHSNHLKNKLKLLTKNPENNIDASFNFGFGSNIFIQGTMHKVTIKNNVHCRNFFNILLYDNSILVINENVFFNNFCSINCLGEIEIGENTIFGENVKLYDHNHNYLFNDNELRIERDKFKIGFIKIGKNCWIGSNVTILKDVEIGDNVIVGANCLVYKSIPSDSIVKHKEDLILTTKQ